MTSLLVFGALGIACVLALALTIHLIERPEKPRHAPRATVRARGLAAGWRRKLATHARAASSRATRLAVTIAGAAGMDRQQGDDRAARRAVPPAVPVTGPGLGHGAQGDPATPPLPPQRIQGHETPQPGPSGYFTDSAFWRSLVDEFAGGA